MLRAIASADQVAIGIVLFRPFHQGKIYFVPVKQSDHPHVFSVPGTRWDFSQPLMSFNRLSNFVCKYPCSGEDEETFVFARILQGEK